MSQNAKRPWLFRGGGGTLTLTEKEHNLQEGSLSSNLRKGVPATYGRLLLALWCLVSREGQSEEVESYPCLAA